VLYVGDHIYGDILRSKKTLGWRTMLVVPELEAELEVQAAHGGVMRELRALRQQRDGLEDQLQRLEWGLAHGPRARGPPALITYILVLPYRFTLSAGACARAAWLRNLLSGRAAGSDRGVVAVAVPPVQPALTQKCAPSAWSSWAAHGGVWGRVQSWGLSSPGARYAHAASQAARRGAEARRARAAGSMSEGALGPPPDGGASPDGEEDLSSYMDVIANLCEQRDAVHARASPHDLWARCQALWRLAVAFLLLPSPRCKAVSYGRSNAVWQIRY
jgi:hypothetical protein